MIIASFMGLLALSACIDGVESPSVTAVRDAKTAELQSIAAMDKAEAEAMVALANAEAALKAAMAEAEAAYAERAAALVAAEALEQQLIDLQKELLTLQTEEARLANQAEQARLEAELEAEKVRQADAEAALEQIKAQMELAKIQNEAALAEAELALKKADNALAAIEEALANAKTEAERAEILAQQAKYQAYSIAYADALDFYISVKQELNSLNWRLLQANNDLTSVQELKNEAIADNNVTIAEYNVYIENFKKYQNYSENVDALKAEYTLASRNYYQILDAYNSKVAEYNNFVIDNQPAQEIVDVIENSDFYKFYTTMRLALPDGSNLYLRSLLNYPNRFSIGYYGDWIGNYGHKRVVIAEHEYGEDVYTYEVPFYALEFEPVDPDIFDLQYNENIVNAEASVDYAAAALESAKSWYDGKPANVVYDDEKKDWTTEKVDDEDVLSAVKAFEAAEKAFNEAKKAYDKEIADVKADLDEAKAATEKAYQDYWFADDEYYWDPTPENEAALAKATEAYNAAQAAQAEAQAAYDELQNPYDEAKNAYFAAMDNVETAKQNVADAEKANEEAEANLEAVKLGASLVRDYDKYLAELQVEIDKLNEIYATRELERIEIWHEILDLEFAMNEASAEYQALEAILYHWTSAYDENGYVGDVYPADAIANEIANLENYIAALKTQNADISDIENAEAYVLYLNQQIEIKTVQLQTAETALNIAKAALESLTKENPAA